MFKGYGYACRFCALRALRTMHGSGRVRHKSASDRAAHQTSGRPLDHPVVSILELLAKTGPTRRWLLALLWSCGETVAAMTSATAMMQVLVRVSLRDERNAACVRLPLRARKRTRRQAQHRFTTSAPDPVKDKRRGAGGTGTALFSQAIQSVAMPEASRIAARAMPTSERWGYLCGLSNHVVAKRSL